MSHGGMNSWPMGGSGPTSNQTGSMLFWSSNVPTGFGSSSVMPTLWDIRIL